MLLIDSLTPWTQTVETILDHYTVSKKGLSTTEALKRLSENGPNIVGRRAPRSATRLLWRQCKNPLVLLLVAASTLSFALGKTHEGFFVLAAIIVNIALGFWQEYKADTAVLKLEHYLKQRSRVMRDGVTTSISSEKIVVGDYILFRTGDRIAADIRLVSAVDLEVDESLLTGESLGVEKSTEALPIGTSLADRNNMLWGGTVITQGTATGIVIATGKETAIGTIANLVNRQEEQKTPLEQSVLQFTKIISIVLVAVGIVITIVGIYNNYPTSDLLLTSIAVIVSAVPESLPIALSVVLAMGAETLAKKHAVVRKMSATETLGTTTVIVTDKTGTLTEGKLLFVGIDGDQTNSNTTLVEATLNADVTLYQNEFLGRPLDVALSHTVATNTVLSELSSSYTVLSRVAFNSLVKYSGVLFERDSVRKVVLLGAADILLEKTTLSEKEKEVLRARITQLSYSGDRVLGSVTMTVHASESIEEAIEKNIFIFSGLLRFRDPIRPSVKGALERIKLAGVRTIVVTGDHPGTAISVAQEIGLVTGKTEVLTGEDIEQMSDTVLMDKLTLTAVFARVTPEQKLRLVELLEKMGEVVAVTGDGVNDAPALKAATIGVAMGSGTDVARASADIIILDNNYGTIVDAIIEGRGVLKKIRTVITYLMADSFDELLLVGGSIMLSIALPITALQILFVKFFSDIFPTLAFTFEKVSPTTSPPLTGGIRLIDRTVAIFTFGRGLLSSSLLFALYIILLRKGFDPALVQTFVYASFSTYMLFLAFSMRNLEESIFTYNPFSNHYLTAGVVVGLSVIMSSIYVPRVAALLGTAPLPMIWLLGVLGIGIINFILIELCKHFLRKK